MNSTFFADTVSETLLIPLYMRAKESRRGEKAIIRDPVAERLVEQIPYDYSKSVSYTHLDVYKRQRYRETFRQ